jgi:hypothetical protein
MEYMEWNVQRIGVILNSVKFNNRIISNNDNVWGNSAAVIFRNKNEQQMPSETQLSNIKVVVMFDIHPLCNQQSKTNNIRQIATRT